MPPLCPHLGIVISFNIWLDVTLARSCAATAAIIFEGQLEEAYFTAFFGEIY